MKKIIFVLALFVSAVCAKAANQYQGTVRDNPVGNIWTSPRAVVVNVADDNPASYMIMIDEDIIIDEIVVGDEQPDGSHPLTRATYVTIDEFDLYIHLESGYIKGDSLVFTMGVAYDSPTNITTRSEYKLEKENIQADITGFYDGLTVELWFGGGLANTTTGTLLVEQEEDNSYTFTFYTPAVNTPDNTFVLSNITVMENENNNADLTMNSPVEIQSQFFFFMNAGEINSISNALNIIIFSGTDAENVHTGIMYLVFKKEGASTALTDISNKEIKIYTQYHNIMIENTTEAVQVYNIGGQIVAQGAGAGCYTVPAAGVYVVRIGSEVRKVLVK